MPSTGNISRRAIVFITASSEISVFTKVTPGTFTLLDMSLLSDPGVRRGSSPITSSPSSIAKSSSITFPDEPVSRINRYGPVWLIINSKIGLCVLISNGIMIDSWLSGAASAAIQELPNIQIIKDVKVIVLIDLSFQLVLNN